MFVAALFPVVAIVKVVGIADVSLVGLAFECGIFGLYIRMVFPGIALVHYGFIHVVPVEVGVSRWQRSAMGLFAILKINILMHVNIVVYVRIGHVIITGMVVPNGAPIGLITNVYAYPKTHLCIGGFAKKTSRQ